MPSSKSGVRRAYVHGLHAAALATAKPAKLAPHVRHERDLDASRERIIRPAGSMPRQESDWR